MANVKSIQEHMEVICSCGKRLGRVDHVEGETIKLTKNDPESGGKHHWIPLNWVDRVDRKVFLNRNSEEAENGWKEEPASMSV